MSFIRIILRDIDLLRAVHEGVRVAKKHIKLIEGYEKSHTAQHERNEDYDCHEATAAFYQSLEHMDQSKWSKHPFAKLAYPLTISSWRNSPAGMAVIGTKITVIPVGPDAFDGIDMSDPEALQAALSKMVETQGEFERVVSETGEPEPKSRKRFFGKGRN